MHWDTGLVGREPRNHYWLPCHRQNTPAAAPAYGEVALGNRGVEGARAGERVFQAIVPGIVHLIDYGIRPLVVLFLQQAVEAQLDSVLHLAVDLRCLKRTVARGAHSIGHCFHLARIRRPEPSCIAASASGCWGAI